MSNTTENIQPQMTTAVESLKRDHVEVEVGDGEAANEKKAKMMVHYSGPLLSWEDKSEAEVAQRAEQYMLRCGAAIQSGNDNQMTTVQKMTDAVVKLTDVEGDGLNYDTRLAACSTGAQNVLERHLPLQVAAMDAKHGALIEVKQAISHLQSRFHAYTRKVEEADSADETAQIYEVLYMSLMNAIQSKVATSEEAAGLQNKLGSVENERDQEREKLKEFTAMVSAFVGNMSGKLD